MCVVSNREMIEDLRKAPADTLSFYAAVDIVSTISHHLTREMLIKLISTGVGGGVDARPERHESSVSSECAPKSGYEESGDISA